MLDEVRQRLSELGVRKKFLESQAVKLLAESLNAGEQIKAWGTGVGTTPTQKQVGLFIASTDGSLILVPSTNSEPTELPRIISYKSIESIRLKTGFMSKLILRISGELEEITIADPKQLRSIAGLIHAAIGGTEPLVDENPQAGKPIFWKLAPWVVLAVLVVIIYFSPHSKEKHEENVDKASVTKELSEDELTSCFIAGESSATVYLSDVVKYSSGGLMPSTVMAKACERKGGATINPQSCIEQCELGFRKVARDALN